MQGDSEALWASVARLISERIGLHFPRERRADLLRGVQAAARDADFQDPVRYARHLLGSPPTAEGMQDLARHLTIGETYFFREEPTFGALSRRVLPELIARRRKIDRRLRVWSAACSTGEEPYSLAMLINGLLLDSSGWQVTILATDLNRQALEKAAAGVYGEWSFRVMPTDMRERYFTPLEGRRFAIRPEIRARVTFKPLNLATDPFPQGIDLILCRNVIIYFTPEKTRELVGKLHGALNEGGWLAVSPSECSQTLFSQFAVENFPDAILYRKDDVAAAKRPAYAAAVHCKPTVHAAKASSPEMPLRSMKEAPSAPVRGSERAPASAPAIPVSSRARQAANERRLAEALTLSAQWIAADKVNPAAHYLHAVVLQELGEAHRARQSLKRCLYLQPNFALASFVLANIERADANDAAATRHYRNAERFLRSCPATEVLEESDGLTAGHLLGIIESLLRTHAPPAVSESSHVVRRR